MWSLFKGAWEHYVDPYVQALIDEPAVEMEVVQASPDIDDLIHELPMDDSPLIFDPELQQDAEIGATRRPSERPKPSPRRLATRCTPWRSWGSM